MSLWLHSVWVYHLKRLKNINQQHTNTPVRIVHENIALSLIHADAVCGRSRIGDIVHRCR